LSKIAFMTASLKDADDFVVFLIVIIIMIHFQAVI